MVDTEYSPRILKAVRTQLEHLDAERGYDWKIQPNNVLKLYFQDIRCPRTKIRGGSIQAETSWSSFEEPPEEFVPPMFNFGLAGRFPAFMVLAHDNGLRFRSSSWQLGVGTFPSPFQKDSTTLFFRYATHSTDSIIPFCWSYKAGNIRFGIKNIQNDILSPDTENLAPIINLQDKVLQDIDNNAEDSIDRGWHSMYEIGQGQDFGVYAGHTTETSENRFLWISNRGGTSSFVDGEMKQTWHIAFDFVVVSGQQIT